MFLVRFNCCKCNGLVMHAKKIHLENYVHYCEKNKQKQSSAVYSDHHYCTISFNEVRT